jgi:hypothetical protein
VADNVAHDSAAGAGRHIRFAAEQLLHARRERRRCLAPRRGLLGEHGEAGLVPVLVEAEGGAAPRAELGL